MGISFPFSPSNLYIWLAGQSLQGFAWNYDAVGQQYGWMAAITWTGGTTTTATPSAVYGSALQKVAVDGPDTRGVWGRARGQCSITGEITGVYGEAEWLGIAPDASQVLRISGVKASAKTGAVATVGILSGVEVLPVVGNGFTATAYGVHIGNVSGAVNNYALRTGTGKVLFGDPNGATATKWTFPGLGGFIESATFGTIVQSQPGSTNDFALIQSIGSDTVMKLPHGLNVPNFPFGVSLGNPAGSTIKNYAEGTWTPTPTSLVGTGITISAVYTRIGNRVDYTLTITGAGLGSTGGVTNLTLPFTPARSSAGIVAGNALAGGPSIASTDGKLYLPTFAALTSVHASGTFFL